MKKQIVKQLCLLFSGLLIVSVSAVMAQVNIRISLDTTSLLIGDHLGVTVDIAADQSAKIETINFGHWADAGKVELLNISELNVVAQQPDLLLQQRLLLTTFDSGYHRFPPLKVVYELNGVRDTALSDDLGLEVFSIPVEEETEIQGNKDIIEEKINWQDLLPFVVGLFFALMLIAIIWRASKKTNSPPPLPPPPPLPAHTIALEKLVKLEEEALWKEGKIKSFQSALTYIFREYLENRFSLQALEATSPEIAKDLNRLELDKDGKIKSILDIADMVKFAKASPPETVHAQALMTIRDFVIQTQEKPAPVESDIEDANEEQV